MKAVDGDEGEGEDEEDDEDETEKDVATKETSLVELLVNNAGVSIKRGKEANLNKKKRVLRVPYGTAVVLQFKINVFYNGERKFPGDTVVWRSYEQEFSIFRIARVQYRLISEKE